MGGIATAVIEPVVEDVLANGNGNEGYGEVIVMGATINPGNGVTRAEAAKVMTIMNKVANDAKTKVNQEESLDALKSSLSKVANPIAGSGVKILKGFLTQTGTDTPIVSVVENGFSEQIEMVRTSAGVYAFESLGGSPGEFEGDIFASFGDVWVGDDIGFRPYFNIGATNASDLVFISDGDNVFLDTPFTIEVHTRVS